MYKVPLTKQQKAENFSDTICIDLIRAMISQQGRGTDEEFASKIGISRPSWSKWCAFCSPPKGKVRADYPRPNLNLVIRAAHMAGVKFDLMIS